MLMKVHHVQISIPKNAEAQARKFYCGVLGLTEIPKPKNLEGRGGFWLSVGDTQIHIGAEDGVNRLATKAHVAFEVNELHPWEEKLQIEGIEIIDGLPVPGYERFEFRDPFGNRMELIQRI